MYSLYIENYSKGTCRFGKENAVTKLWPVCGRLINALSLDMHCWNLPNLALKLFERMEMTVRFEMISYNMKFYLLKAGKLMIEVHLNKPLMWTLREKTWKKAAIEWLQVSKKHLLWTV